MSRLQGFVRKSVVPTSDAGKIGYLFLPKVNNYQCVDSNNAIYMQLIDLSQEIIPHVPTEAPQLGHLVYEMILGYFIAYDKQVVHVNTLHVPSTNIFV